MSRNVTQTYLVEVYPLEVADFELSGRREGQRNLFTQTIHACQCRQSKNLSLFLRNED